VSIETLQDDLKANMASVRQMNDLTTAGEIVSHLKNTFWPFMESAVDEMVQLDGCVEDLLNHAEDILQPETGALFLGLITGGLGLVGELRRRLTPSDDPKLLAAIAEFEKNANEATEVLTEITIPMQDEDEDEEDDEGDEDEGVE
jgi:hypothetical protein